MTEVRDVAPLTAADIPWDLAPAPDVPHDPDDLLVETLVDVQSYRTVAQQAIHALHREMRECARLRARRDELRDELRRYTAAAVVTEAT